VTRNSSPRLIVAWVAALCGIGWTLVRVGHGSLAAPPSGSGLAALQQWASARDAPTMAMSVVRLLALVLDGYLLATIVLGTAARLTRCAAAVRAADLVSPRSVRRLLGTTLGGLMLSASASAPFAVPSAWQPTRPAVARIAAGPREVRATAGPRVVRATAGPRVVRATAGPREVLATRGPPVVRAAGGPPLVRAAGADAPLLRLISPSLVVPGVGALPVPSPSTRARPTTLPLPPPRVVPPPVRPRVPLGSPSAPSGPTSWTVRRGDNFWEIARVAMAATTPDPTARTVAPYWRSLINANRDRFRGNPNLIYAGEVFVIPPPPP
jgi:nucleoid-associated protein YgaU